MEKLNLRAEERLQWSSRKFVRVAPPTVHASIGEALRRAFHPDRDHRAPGHFDDLLARLG